MLQRIQRAQNTPPALVEYMGVNHGRAHIGMAQQLLHRANVITRLQQMRGKRMAQHMGRDGLIDIGQPSRLPHGALHGFGVHMVAPLDILARACIGSWINGTHG